ncbi:MAG: RimK family alpha-L-glutamate ligase [Pseudomonadota bacterium]|nr:RimK family alpha-L-glutamate ligase [Pseudomonadota bacterium]
MPPSAERPRAEGRVVALFGDAEDWHARRLTRAFARRGVRVVTASLRDCAIDTAQRQPLRLPGLDGRLPDAALVRTVPGGSFEAVTLRLGVLHALRAEGVTVWNDPRAIERCVDKSMTSFLVARAGLPTPPTWVVEGRERAAGIVAREAAAGSRLVLKPLFGAQGRGLCLIRAAEELPQDDTVAGVYYLQRYVGAEAEGWHDYRVLVCGGRVLAAMIRHGTGWITNLHQGARAEPYRPEPEPEALALAAVRAVGAAYAGVDLIRDAQGRWFVLEVNSMPAWSGLQAVTSVDIAARIADDLLETLAGVEPAAAAP